MVPLDMLAAWVAGAYARVRGGDPERGDVPGWVMVTVMTAGLTRRTKASRTRTAVLMPAISSMPA